MLQYYAQICSRAFSAPSSHMEKKKKRALCRWESAKLGRYVQLGVRLWLPSAVFILEGIFLTKKQLRIVVLAVGDVVIRLPRWFSATCSFSRSWLLGLDHYSSNPAFTCWRLLAQPSFNWCGFINFLLTRPAVNRGLDFKPHLEQGEQERASRALHRAGRFRTRKSRAHKYRGR